MTAPVVDQIRLSPRKRAIRARADRQAPLRARWRARSRYFHDADRRFLRFLIPEGLEVLELGCGIGDLLAALEPSRGVGIDLSPGMVEVARQRHPQLEVYAGDVERAEDVSRAGGPFDVILMADTIGSLDDCQAALEALHPLTHAETRVVIAYYSVFWEPLLRLLERIGLKMPQERQNWLTTQDIANLLELTDFEIVRRDWRILIPARLLGLGPLINRTLATLPGLRRLCLRNYIVARPVPRRARQNLSATVVIPCRNERGNVEEAVRRMPRLCDDLEILFVEGHSEDGTFEEIERVIAAHPELDIKGVRQDGKGKGDAVRKGFELARGEVLMILDADLTVPPEDLPKFYDAVARGKGELINGSRLVYPMEREAMRFLNSIANQIFSWLFRWLLNQRFTDTLCGTKVLTRDRYRQIARNRAYFGDFDPFGDFDLIFGAAKLSFKVVEVPIRYRSRSYGETQISRFRHGWLLLRMVVFAFYKLKAL